MTEPFLVRARLIKNITDDGLCPLTGDVALGDVFIVDLSTRATAVLFHQQYGVTHEKVVVQSVMDGGWLPMECLELFT